MNATSVPLTVTNEVTEIAYRAATFRRFVLPQETPQGVDFGLAEISRGDFVVNLGKEERLFSVHTGTEVYFRNSPLGSYRHGAPLPSVEVNNDRSVLNASRNRDDNVAAVAVPLRVARSPCFERLALAQPHAAPVMRLGAAHGPAIDVERSRFCWSWESSHARLQWCVLSLLGAAKALQRAAPSAPRRGATTKMLNTLATAAPHGVLAECFPHNLDEVSRV